MSILRCAECGWLIDTDEDVEAYWGYEPGTPEIRNETVTATTIDRWLCPSCREPYENAEDEREYEKEARSMAVSRGAD